RLPIPERFCGDQLICNCRVLNLVSFTCMKSRTTLSSVWRRATRCYFLRLSPSVTTTPVKCVAKCGIIIAMRAMNYGVRCSGVLFHLLSEWPDGVFFPNSVTPPGEGGRGYFASLSGGGGRSR